jgi:hypothetical protein
MSLIQTAQNVDLSNANVTHVAGNQYNNQLINVYGELQVLNSALDVRDFLVPAMLLGTSYV